MKTKNKMIKKYFFIFNLLIFINEMVFPNEIIIEPLRIDFGYVETNTKTVKTFKLKSNVNKDILIEAIQPSCGCISIKSDDNKIIEPFKQKDIEIIFDSSNLVGEKNYTILVVSKTDVTNTVTMDVNAYVKTIEGALIKIFPDKLEFNFMKDEKESKARLIIKNFGSSVLECNLNSDCKDITFSCNNLKIKSGNKEIVAIILRNNRISTKHGNIVIKSNAQNIKEKIIPFSVSIQN